MTVLPLTKLWINRLDTTEAISAQTDPNRSQAHSIDTKTITFTSGRRRAISVPGERGQLGWSLILVPLVTVAKLRTWAGFGVQVRDHRGQKFFGTFDGVAVTEVPFVDQYNVAFTLETFTYDEGV